MLFAVKSYVLPLQIVFYAFWISAHVIWLHISPSASDEFRHDGFRRWKMSKVCSWIISLFFRKIYVKSLVLCFRSPYKGTDIVLNSVTSVFLQKILILSGKKDDLGRPYWKICKIFKVDICFTFFQKLLLISQWKLCFSFKSTFFFSLRP